MLSVETVLLVFLLYYAVCYNNYTVYTLGHGIARMAVFSDQHNAPRNMQEPITKGHIRSQWSQFRHRCSLWYQSKHGSTQPLICQTRSHCKCCRLFHRSTSEVMFVHLAISIGSCRQKPRDAVSIDFHINTQSGYLAMVMHMYIARFLSCRKGGELAT